MVVLACKTPDVATGISGIQGQPRPGLHETLPQKNNSNVGDETLSSEGTAGEAWRPPEAWQCVCWIDSPQVQVAEEPGASEHLEGGDHGAGGKRTPQKQEERDMDSWRVGGQRRES